MPLQYGSELEDISGDEEDLAAFLEMARDREAGIDGAVIPGADFEPFEGDFEADPDTGFGDEGGLADRIIPDSFFEPPKGRPAGARLRKDIQAKTAMLLLPVGSVWKARDEYCGGAFVDAIPDVSEKLTAIFVDSPDVVKWFTASGKWMKWLDLAMACEPVGKAVVAHHVTHSADRAQTEPDWTVYAAG